MASWASNLVIWFSTCPEMAIVCALDFNPFISTDLCPENITLEIHGTNIGDICTGIDES